MDDYRQSHHGRLYLVVAHQGYRDGTDPLFPYSLQKRLNDKRSET